MPSNRVVLADGCFDPLHVGHIRYLRAASRMGQNLYVQVAPDDAIRAKGREPFQTRDERRITVGALADVTCAVDTESLVAAIVTFRPDVLAKGIEWVGRLPSDVVKACRANNVEIVY